METLESLCGRYNQNQDMIGKFILKYWNIVDPDGTHITKDGKTIYFDDFAVALFDKFLKCALLQAKIEIKEKEILKLKKEIDRRQRLDSRWKWRWDIAQEWKYPWKYRWFGDFLPRLVKIKMP